MKILCPGFILLIGFYSNILHAQTPGWVWLKGAKGNGAQEGVAIATDKYNNVYMTGDYQDGADTVLFDSVLITTTVPYNNSLYILVKYSPTGKALWARTSYVVSDWGTSGGLSICTDQSANVLVTGVFDDSMKFDNTHILTGGGIFTVCYDSLGNVLGQVKEKVLRVLLQIV